jgi:hypothetical protein
MLDAQAAIFDQYQVDGRVSFDFFDYDARVYCGQFASRIA